MSFGSDSVLKHASGDFKKMGQRIFVFVIGGATRSEVFAILPLVFTYVACSPTLINAICEIL